MVRWSCRLMFLLTVSLVLAGCGSNANLVMNDVKKRDPLPMVKQGVHISRPVEIQIVLLWGVQNGVFDKVELKEMPDYIRRVTEYFSNLKKDFLDRLYSEKVLSDDLVAELKAIFEEWQKTQG